MEKERGEKYYVGQPVDRFIDCSWKACLVTSVKASQPPSYGIITIEKGRNFYLSSNSIRHWTERRLLVEDSFQEYQGANELNVSVLSTDDNSLFITPSNVADEARDEDSLVEEQNDSLLDFAKKTEDFLRLTGTSTPRAFPAAVNGCQLMQRPSTEDYGTGSFLGSSEHTDIAENRVPNDLELDQALSLVDDDFLNEPLEEGIDNPPAFVAPHIPEKQSVRFAQVDEKEVENLQKASKSERTHKQTQWAIKILTGINQ